MLDTSIDRSKCDAAVQTINNPFESAGQNRTLDDLIESIIWYRISGGGPTCRGLFAPLSNAVNAAECMVSASSLADGIMHLHRLKNAKTTLAIFHRYLELQVDVLRLKLGPASLHHGVSSLPNELLVKIFLEVVEACHRCQFRAKAVANLSSVCRRFRKLIYDCPRFWAHICTSCFKSRKDWLEEHLRLSKNTALHVKVENRYEDFMQLALLHKQRWATLELMDVYELDDIVERYSGTVFPSTIQLDAFFDIEDPDQACCSWFFTSWSFPNLRFLDVSGAVPSSIHFSNLTEARLSVFPTDDGGLFETYLQKALLFLQQAPGLEKLLIDISYVFSSEGLPECVVSLPYLVSFNLISCMFHEGIEEMDAICPLDTIKEFLRALRTPKLKTLSLSIAVEETPDVSHIDFILPPSLTYPSVEKLFVEMKSLQGALPPATIRPRQLFMRFPRLTDLVMEVECARFKIEVLEVQEQLKGLRSLSMVDFEIDYGRVWDLLERLSAAGITLQELKIAPQRYFDTRDLQKKYPRTKITIQENFCHCILGHWW